MAKTIQEIEKEKAKERKVCILLSVHIKSTWFIEFSLGLWGPQEKNEANGKRKEGPWKKNKKN